MSRIRASAQEIMALPEERWVLKGANMLALRLIDDFGKDGSYLARNKKNVVYLLEFLTRERYNMEMYIYFSTGLYFEQVEGKKTEYTPRKIIPREERELVGAELINRAEFLTKDEQKFRKTARVLLDIVEKEAEMIALLTGRTKEEVLNMYGFTGGDK